MGYPTAFVVAPLALYTFVSANPHRRWGKIYLFSMIFLYCTGTFLTLTRHPWLSWGFARNLTFNFFGFSTVIYGYRSIRLFNDPGKPIPARLDYGLAGILIVSVLAMLSVAIVKDIPMRVFTAVGIFLSVLEARELRQSFKPREILLRRHVRYILTSYYYLLTVVSIVHLADELPGKSRWLWPTIVGCLIVGIASITARQPVEKNDPKALTWAVYATILIGLCLGFYVVYDLMSGAKLSMQAFSATTLGSTAPSGNPAPPTLLW